MVECFEMSFLFTSYGHQPRYSSSHALRRALAPLDSELSNTTHFSNPHKEDVAFAIQWGSMQLLEDFCKTNLQTFIECLGHNSAHLAAKTGNLESLQFLKGLSFDLIADTADDFSRSTPLMIAAANGHVDCVKFLIENTRHLNSKSLFLAADIAIMEGFERVATILVNTLSQKTDYSIPLEFKNSSFLAAYINEKISQLIGVCSDDGAEKTSRLFRILTFLAVQESSRRILHQFLPQLSSLIRKFKDSTTFFSESSSMLLLASLMMAHDSVAHCFHSEAFLKLCTRKILHHQKMVPRGPVCSASFALLESLRYGGERNIHKLLSLPMDVIETSIRAIDNFCSAVDWEETEIDFPCFTLHYESRNSVAAYRESLRDGLFRAIKETFPKNSHEFKMLSTLYRQDLHVTCCGFTHHPTRAVLLDEISVLQALSREALADQGRIDKSPLKHPVCSQQVLASQEVPRSNIVPADFLKWITDNESSLLSNEANKSSVAFSAVSKDEIIFPAYSDILKASSFEYAVIQPREPSGIIAQVTEPLELRSLEGLPLEIKNSQECEVRKTYAQACNENASSFDRSCVESRLMQSYLDATLCSEKTPWESNAMTKEQILKRTLAIFKQNNPGLRPPLETVELLRQISHSQSLKYLEEPDMSAFIPLRPLGSVELLPVQCSRWKDDAETLIGLSQTDVVNHKNLRYSIPNENGVGIGNSYFGHSGNRVTLALEQDVKGGRKKLVAIREFSRRDAGNFLVDYCVRRLEDFTKQIRKEPSHLALYEHFIETERKWILVRSVCDYNLDEYIGREMNDWNPNLMEKVASVFYQILKGLEFMHQSVPILFHGNLKPNNVLIDSHEIVRLVDFGFGKLCAQKHNTSGHCLLPDGTFHPICWKPPEFYSIAMTYNGLSDMHSVAMIAYYMMTSGKEHPFVTDDHMQISELNDLVLRGRHNFKKTLPKEAKDLLNKMLQVNPSDRPHAAEVMKHPFFWAKEKRIAFLLTIAYCLIGDRLSMDPSSFAELEKTFAADHHGEILSRNWRQSVPRIFEEDLELLEVKEPSVVDLLLFLLEVYRKVPAVSKAKFFLDACPNLFMIVYSAIEPNYFWKNTKNIRKFFVTQ